MFGFLELEDDPEILPALLAAAEGWLTARGRDEHDRPDGLHDERRERRPHRGLRPRADDQAAVAPAVLPAALRGGGPGEGRSTSRCGSSTSPTARRCCRSCSTSPAKLEPEHGVDDPQDVAPVAAQGHGPLRRGLQLRLGAQLGLRALLQERPRPVRRRSCSSSSTRTGSWSPRRTARRSRIAITVPDVNQVLKKMNGRSAAVRLVDLPAQEAPHRPRAASGFLGVKPEYQHTGVAAGLYVEHFEHGRHRPAVTWGEMGWILETNRAMNRGMEAMNGRMVKRYRVYEKLCAESGREVRLAVMDASVVASPSVARLGSSSEGIWLRSRNWDLGFLILSAVARADPAAALPRARRLADGGQPDRRRAHRRPAPVLDVHLHVPGAQLPRAATGRSCSASLALPVLVTILAFVNLQVLLTIFFTWASIHVLHQITYINDCYVGEAARCGGRRASGSSTTASSFTVPVSDGDAADPRPHFQLGGHQLYVPHWADHGFIADAQIFAAFALFGTFFVLWVGKNDPRVARGHADRAERPADRPDDRRRLHAAAVPEHRRRLPGLQLLALVPVPGADLVPEPMRKERGEIDNHFVAEVNGPNHPLAFYGMNVV